MPIKVFSDDDPSLAIYFTVRSKTVYYTMEDCTTSNMGKHYTANDQSGAGCIVISKFGPTGVVCSCPGAIHTEQKKKL